LTLKSEYTLCCWIERYPKNKYASGDYAIVCCDIYHGGGPAAYAYGNSPQEAKSKALQDAMGWKGFDDPGRLMILEAQFTNDHSYKREKKL